MGATEIVILSEINQKDKHHTFFFHKQAQDVNFYVCVSGCDSSSGKVTVRKEKKDLNREGKESGQQNMCGMDTEWGSYCKRRGPGGSRQGGIWGESEGEN